MISIEKFKDKRNVSGEFREKVERDIRMGNRDGFKSRTGFVLACIGSAVGMGNIWRFPYMVSEWGGMTFLLPYVLFVILIASTGVIEEMALGRAAKSGPISAFGKCTEIRTGNKRTGEVIGVVPVLGSLALAIGYTVVVGWIFKYAFLAITGGLFRMGQDMDAIGGLFGGTASSFGNNLWQVVAMIVTAVIMAYGIAGGIEKANKVMMPLLFVLFLGLGAYIFRLPGSGQGYRYIFTLNPQGLLNPRLWIYAFGQAFFSLSIAGNGTVIYGSYLSEGSIVDYVTKTAVGMPIGSFYGYVTDGIFNTYEEVKASAQYEPGKLDHEQTTRPGDFRFKDLNGDGKITAEDRTYLGSPLPDFVFGIPLQFSYGDFDLNIFFQGQTGNKIFNVMDYYLYNAAEGNVYADIRSKHWSGQLAENRAFFPLNTDAEVPDLDSSDSPRNFRSSDFFVKDGSYLRLKELRLSYNVPKKLISKWKIDNLSFSLTAYNLLTFTGYDGFDPEVGKVSGTESNNLSMGVDHGNYPQARSFTLGFKIGL